MNGMPVDSQPPSDASFLYSFRNSCGVSRALRWIPRQAAHRRQSTQYQITPDRLLDDPLWLAETQNPGCLRLAEELGQCVALDQSARYKSTARRSISGAGDRGHDGKANFN